MNQESDLYQDEDEALCLIVSAAAVLLNSFLEPEEKPGPVRPYKPSSIVYAPRTTLMDHDYMTPNESVVVTEIAHHEIQKPQKKKLQPKVKRVPNRKRDRNKFKTRRFWVDPHKKTEVAVEHKNLSLLVGRKVSLFPSLFFERFTPFRDEDFAELLKLVGSDIKKQDSCMREAVSTENRLAVTLRYLMTGEGYVPISKDVCGMGYITMLRTVPETCRAIINKLGPLYFQEPVSCVDWTLVSAGFEMIWDYKMCLGAVSGRRMQSPYEPKEGKTTHSIDILGICDAEYRFLQAEVTVNRTPGDGELWKCSQFFEELENKDLPPSAPLPGRYYPVSYHFVGDANYEMSPRLMTPYSDWNLDPAEGWFNQRIERVQSVAEKAFRTLENRFRFLTHAFHIRPGKVTSAVKAAICLHNFLISRNPEGYLFEEDELPESYLLPLQPDMEQILSLEALEMREELKDFYSN